MTDEHDPAHGSDAHMCATCDRQGSDVDREGWHLFFDGADHHAVCPMCLGFCEAGDRGEGGSTVH